MKLVLAFIGFVVLASQGTEATKATLEQLKAFEKFSPYPWTQWLKFHPGSAAAVAIAPAPYRQPEDSEEDSEEDDTDADSDEPEFTEDDLQTWFKRATLPEVIDTLIDSDKEEGDSDSSIVQAGDPKKKSKAAKTDKTAAKAEKDKAKLLKKAEKLTATKKPSLVDVEPDFWAPPPSIAPNVTVLPPPGYWASKKAMFISKLFAALAEAVVNSTGPPEQLEVTTTTPSPRQALLEELNNVLLNDVARSAPLPAESDESEESDEEDSDEVPALAPVTPTSAPTKLDFLGKLSSAIAAKPTKPTKAPSPWAWGKPTKAPKKTKAKKVKGGKKGADAMAPTGGLDYDALAKALLANGATPSKSKKA